MPIDEVNYARKAHLRIDQLEIKHADLERAIAANTKLTQTIADNTSELVELVRGVKGFRRLLIWAAPVLAAVLAAMAYMKGLK